MAKIKVLGKTVQVISTLTLEDIKELEKLAPNALVVIEKDEDDESIPVFKIGTGETGSIGQFGITFDGKTRQGGFATVSYNVNFEGNDDELMEALADKLMKPYAYLQKIEESAPEKLAEIKDVRKVFMESITLE